MPPTKVKIREASPPLRALYKKNKPPAKKEPTRQLKKNKAQPGQIKNHGAAIITKAPVTPTKKKVKKVVPNAPKKAAPLLSMANLLNKGKLNNKQVNKVMFKINNI